MFLVPLLLIILIVWVFAYILRFPGSNGNNQINGNSQAPINNNRALEVLKERYAKGEVSEEEFLKIKRNLE